MPDSIELTLFIEPERQGTYFTLPFSMPAGIEALALSYRYDRFVESEHPFDHGMFTARQEVNIIDLGLISPDGRQVGASGSDKTEITLSETRATPGYHPTSLFPGEWQILVGAYKVAPAGVKVTYTLRMTPKTRRLFKGDLHTHTVASDGVLTLPELGGHARCHGLDFLAVTDHNQMVAATALPQIEGLTFIPGVEWTHYQGHANFLGLDVPYDAPFATNTPEEALARFESARQRGALITLNHPFEEGMGFLFDPQVFPFDCLEVWNGPMRPSNLQAVAFWQRLLSQGKKVPICGGSDYHRDSPFQILGGPTTCVYAESASPADILAALRQGHAYITFAPNGPSLELAAGDGILGDSVAWSDSSELQLVAEGLLAGDVVRVVSASGAEPVLQAPAAGRLQAHLPVKEPGFAYIEILRAFLPGLPMLPALISNPIYFE